MARYFVMTDLEGVVGVDSWAQVRAAEDDFDPEAEARAKDELAREVNACVAGIREARPDAEIDVFDGHGRGGLREGDLEGATYMREGFDLRETHPLLESDYAAQLYVGQHAMAGTAFAPLRHTQSSLGIEHYKLNGTFIGEFAGGAVQAGVAGVPTAFLAGDDKACHEAAMFVPEIETTAVKYGKGEEAAEHRAPEAAHEAIREGAARAVERADEIPPLDGFEPPYTVEVRYREPREGVPEHYRGDGIEATQVDPYTVRAESERFLDVYP